MDKLLKSCFEFARDAILAGHMMLEREVEIISQAFDVSVPFTRHHLTQLCDQKIMKPDNVREACRPKRNHWLPDGDRDGLDG